MLAASPARADCNAISESSAMATGRIFIGNTLLGPNTAHALAMRAGALIVAFIEIVISGRSPFD
jgi:hypothetical protein